MKLYALNSTPQLFLLGFGCASIGLTISVLFSNLCVSFRTDNDIQDEFGNGTPYHPPRRELCKVQSNPIESPYGFPNGRQTYLLGRARRPEE